MILLFSVVELFGAFIRISYAGSLVNSLLELRF